MDTLPIMALEARRLSTTGVLEGPTKSQQEHLSGRVSERRPGPAMVAVVFFLLDFQVGNINVIRVL